MTFYNDNIERGGDEPMRPADPEAMDERAQTWMRSVDQQHKAARRILVADDNCDAADTLQMLLSIDGHDVRVAKNGEEAVKLAENFHPELLLLDIGMPKLDGYQVAENLRTRYPRRRMTLVALSGWGQERDKLRAQGSGFDRHLTKPIDPNVLDDIIRNLPAADSSNP